MSLIMNSLLAVHFLLSITYSFKWDSVLLGILNAINEAAQNSGSTRRLSLSHARAHRDALSRALTHQGPSRRGPRATAQAAGP